jgi:hypothetical protein
VTIEVLRRGRILTITAPLDPRPESAVDIPAMEEFRRPREAQAERYWSENFAPLVGEGVS